MMRNIRDLITDYVEIMGYKGCRPPPLSQYGHEEVNRLMIQFHTADEKEQKRLVRIMIDGITPMVY